MSTVFLDTVGLIAVWDVSDQWHTAASKAFEDLLRSSCRLVTTPEVLLECGNASARRPYRSRVNALRQALLTEGLLVSPIFEEVETAWNAYDQGIAAGAGIVDHLSFAVMHRLAISAALTNDKHFQAAGFVILF